MTKYSDGNKTSNMTQGTKVGYSAGKNMSKTAMPKVNVGNSAGKDTGKTTNRAGDPKGARNKD